MTNEEPSSLLGDDSGTWRCIGRLQRRNQLM